MSAFSDGMSAKMKCQKKSVSVFSNDMNLLTVLTLRRLVFRILCQENGCGRKLANLVCSMFRLGGNYGAGWVLIIGGPFDRMF